MKRKKYVRIEFVDNGIGIPDMQKRYIFLNLPKGSQRKKGMGLGLSLVKKLIGLYGGQVWVEDKYKGEYSKGSNFIILIPEFGIVPKIKNIY